MSTAGLRDCGVGMAGCDDQIRNCYATPESPKSQRPISIRGHEGGKRGWAWDSETGKNFVFSHGHLQSSADGVGGGRDEPPGLKVQKVQTRISKPGRIMRRSIGTPFSGRHGKQGEEKEGM